MKGSLVFFACTEGLFSSAVKKLFECGEKKIPPHCSKNSSAVEKILCNNTYIS